jgi:hypothetical protein
VIAVRNARSEATARLPEGYEGLVLEPSPPASNDREWYADDPTDPSGTPAPIVTPIDGEGITWTQMARNDPSLAAYATDHWLGAHRRLEPLPGEYAEGRRVLHQVAFFALAPKRFDATGKLGLRYTHRGFGTPFFGDDEQVRVEGNRLIHQRGGRAQATPITSLRDATEILDIPFRDVWFDDFRDPPTPEDPDADLLIDPAVTDAIGEWFGFATSVLEQTRRTRGAVDVSRVQLWPEHFDLAFEMGADDRRAGYGASAGDDAHPEPYLYVAAWGTIDRSDPFWNDAAFNGSALSYRSLLAATDQRSAALDFLARGYGRLTAGDSAGG